MKIWRGYGSEHSMRLVMIGRFKEIGDMKKAEQIINDFTEIVRHEVELGNIEEGEPIERYSENIIDLIHKHHAYVINPSEVDQFNFPFDVDIDADSLTIKTEESEFSAFLKIFIHCGARIELFSKHDYPSQEPKLNQEEGIDV